MALDLPALVRRHRDHRADLRLAGHGQLAITAVFGRDYPVIMGITLIGAVMIVFCNLLADVVYAVIDPRIKYS